MRKFASILWVSLLILSVGTSCVGQSAKHTEIRFEKHVLCDTFVSEGVTVADINKDGHKDIIAGAYWFEAPTWKQHELAVPQAFEYDKGYSNAFLHFALDVDQDGWMDVIRIGLPGEPVVWYKNPANKSGHWVEHPIYSSLGNENPNFVDVNGDGRPDLIGNDSKNEKVIWLEAPSQTGDITWKKHMVSEVAGLGTHQYTHGLGFDDINGDGRRDILITKGWWEAPAKDDGQPWEFHPVTFSEDCAEMYAYDVNNDGLLDIVSSSAHNYGVWWHEQQRDNTGEERWVKHVIDSTFSQSHALALKDVNRDGHLDMITGKRFFAHNGHDPGAFEPAVLKWYEYLPGEPPYWRAHEVDDDSGVGLQVVVEDVDGDGLPDIVVSNKKGVFFTKQLAHE